jgi:excisionase family DNA binding protein
LPIDPLSISSRKYFSSGVIENYVRGDIVTGVAAPITTIQAAKTLGVTKARVLALIWEGRLPAAKFGNQYMIDPADLAKVKDRPTGRPPKAKGEKAKRKGK